LCCAQINRIAFRLGILGTEFQRVKWLEQEEFEPVLARLGILECVEER
jgi:hypothetical protein